MGKDMLTATKYITTVPFSRLFNWSVQYLIDSKISFSKAYPMMRIGDFLKRNKTAVTIENDKTYKRVTIKVRNGGIFLRDERAGNKIGTKNQFLISKGQFLLSKIDARNGAFGVVPEVLDGGIITGNFWTFDVDYTRIDPHYLVLLTTTNAFIQFCEQASNGTTNRHYLQELLFLNIKVPIPPLEEQNILVKSFNNIMALIQTEEKKAIDIKLKSTISIRNALKISTYSEHIEKKIIYYSNYSNINSWSVQQILHAEHTPFGKSKLSCKKLSELAYINPKTDFSLLSESDEMSFIPMEDISDNYGEWMGNKTTIKSRSKGYTKFQNGDIIWARITPCMQNGKSSFLQNLVNNKGCGSTEFHVIRIISDEVLPQYIHTLLRHFDVLTDAKKYFTGSAGQQRVPASYLNNLLIPIPELKIQKQIVNKYNRTIEQIKQMHLKILNYKLMVKKNFEAQFFE